MDCRLDGKNALITGASRGIGRAIAEGMAAEGAQVAVNYVADQTAADAVVAGIRARGGQATAIQADTTDTTAIRDLFATAERAMGGLDIVVHNAHPGFGHGVLTELEETEIDQQLAVLKSYVIGLQEASRRVRDHGVIVCISSTSTRFAHPPTGLYSSTKLAIEQLARSLSRELAPRSVRVLSVAPGLTRTDRIAGWDTGTTPVSEPEDIANAVVFLVSNAARQINTTTVFVNGGIAYAQ